jgi:hypothetical protein
MNGGLERTKEEGRRKVMARELSDTTEATAETEPGEGEPFCGYGVEVVELLEMEPAGPRGAARAKKRPWRKYASVAFILAFALGIANAGASLYMASLVVSPADLAGTRGCEISGEVQDTGGNPIPNATVVVTDTTKSAFTNRDGLYVLKGIPPGSHRVEAAAEGYNHMSVRTYIHPDMLNVIDFTLEKGAPDVSTDESSAPDFAQAGNSYMWAVPLMVCLSVCALVAAMMSLGRKPRWRATALLGSLAILSFGFAAGSVAALAGVAMTAMALPEEGPLPKKKLRVGISYPSMSRASRRPAGVAGAPPSSAAPEGPTGTQDRPAMSPATDAQGGEMRPGKVPGGGGPPTELSPVPAPEPAEQHPQAARPPPLQDRTAEGELETAGAPGQRAKEASAPGPPRPRRLVRRSDRERLLCASCVELIQPGSVYIKCVCGRSVHAGCLKQASCPACGETFGRGGR